MLVTKKIRRWVIAPPAGPGDVLRERFLADGTLTQDRLAEAMNVSRFSVNQIINRRRSVTAEMAIRLGYVTSTSPELWLNLQRSVDLYEAELKLGDEIKRLRVLRSAKADSELYIDNLEAAD